MPAEKTYCLHDGKLLKGRVDKLFCNDDCRNAYNNEKNRIEQKEIGAIDLTLKKNRRILKALLGTAKTKSVTEKQLLVKGFIFRYHTHIFSPPSGETYHFCYDYGYQPKDDNKYMIVRELPIVREKE